MATKLSISDLADVLAALTEIIRPYQLGIQLKIDSPILKTIEKNHSRDIGRQKTEVIEYWLRNSPDASWTTLANAVERMGGHARLAETLREEIKSEELKQDTSAIKAERVGGYADTVENKNKEGKRTISANEVETSLVKVAVASGEAGQEEQIDELFPRRRTTSMQLSFVGERRDVLLLGKMGHGKSTLGNRMLDCDGCFRINDHQCPQTTPRCAMLHSASQLKDYRVDVYDHTGLFEDASSISALSHVVPRRLHLVVFVWNQKRTFDESKIKFIISRWEISKISALVLTHCEHSSKEEREEVIKRFKKDHPSVAELMGKGILAVGFPDGSYVESGTELSERVEGDKANLRQLIYSCDESVLISPPVHISEPPQNSNRQHFCCKLCCSIL